MYRVYDYEAKMMKKKEEQKPKFTPAELLDYFIIACKTLYFIVVYILAYALFRLCIKRPIRFIEKRFNPSPITQVTIMASFIQLIGLITILTTGSYLYEKPDYSFLYYSESSVGLPTEKASDIIKEIRESKY